MGRCLQTTLALLLILLLSPTTQAQNGGDRGGGGKYAAEVYNMARGIAKKLRLWKKDLKVSEAQIHAVERIVDLDPADRSDLLEVYSFEHVYRFPQFAPAPKAGEVTLINIFKTRPTDKPRIEVGELKWEKLAGQALEKEMLLIHELFGAAGILKKGQRIDATFLHSYEYKLKTLKKWEEFKESLKFTYYKMSWLASKVAKPDISNLKTSILILNHMPQYDKVMNPEKYMQGDAAAINRFQSENYLELLFTWLSSLTELKQNANEGTKDTIAEYYKLFADAQVANPAMPDSWNLWSRKLLKDFDQSLAKALTPVQEISGDLLYLEISRVCDDHDRKKTLECLTHFTNVDVEKLTAPRTLEARKQMDVELSLVFDKLSSTITPDDIR